MKEKNSFKKILLRHSVKGDLVQIFKHFGKNIDFSQLQEVKNRKIQT